MIKHVVLFRFTSESTEEQRAAMLDELGGLPNKYPAMKSWALGVNESHRDDRFSHGFVVEFASWELLDDYLLSKEHEELVAERFRPIVAERAIVTYSFEP